MSLAPDPVRHKWLDPGAALRYSTTRFRSARRRERDPRLVDALLAEFLPRSSTLLLDAPCGAGRLRAVLERHGRYVGLDVSPSMLAALRAGLGTPERPALLQGDVEHLPFRTGAFDAVVACRLLHHLADRSALARVLSELVRVSRGLVIASYWDSASLPAWRRALLPSRRIPRRHVRSKQELALALHDAGAEVLGWRHSLRFVSRQAFVVARKNRP